MKHMPIKPINGPAYTHGAFAPGRITLKICPSCGRRISFEADRCGGCGADKANGWKPMKLDASCDFQTVFTSGGGIFKKGEAVSVYAKNGYMTFKTESGGGNFVNIKTDFFLCSRTKTAFGDMISLVFSDFTVNMRDNDIAEKIMLYIYENITDSVYEKEKVFYNANHELFPL